MDTEDEFRTLIRRLAGAMTEENVRMIKYLCKDLSNFSQFKSSIALFEHFEDKGWIGFSDLSFLAEILYRINRHDLLKLFPNVKNRKDYEQNFLPHQHQNFTHFRITCFQLTGELSDKDFEILKNFCKNKLSGRNYNRSKDIFTLLECLEEEDLLSDGDTEFMLNSLRHLDNQTPYKLFQELNFGNQLLNHTPQTTAPKLGSYQSMPNFSVPPFNNPKFHVTHYQYHSTPALDNFFNNQSTHKFAENDQTIPKPPSDMFVDGTYGHSKINENITSRLFVENESSNHPQKNHHELTNISTKPFLQSEANQIDCKTEISSPELSSTVMKHPFSEENEPCFFDDTSCNAGFDVPDSYPSASLLHSVESTQNEMGQLSDAVLLDSDLNQPAQHLFANVPIIRNPGVDHYPMNSAPVGLCLIINNVSFEGSINVSEARRRYELKGHDYPVPNIGLKDRIGSKLDVEKVSKLFTDFGFKIELHENLDSRAMQKVLQSVAKRDHSRYNCFVLIVMSHGTLGSVYGIDGMPVRCAEIKSHFKPVSAPTLLNKPKILIYQACQGDQSMDGHAAPIDDIETDGPPETALHPTTPSEADFLICYSTVPGYISYRSRSTGSFFISRVVENLRTLYNTEDVVSIMANVNAELATESLNQMAMPVSTLRKKVFFKLQNQSIS